MKNIKGEKNTFGISNHLLGGGLVGMAALSLAAYTLYRR
jgi:hypothetical protein